MAKQRNVIEEQVDYYLAEEDLQVEPNELCGFVLTLFNLRTQLHIWHLQTINRGEHIDLNELYDAIPGIADELGEGMQGLGHPFAIDNRQIKFVSWSPEVVTATLASIRATTDSLFEKYANNSVISGPLADLAPKLNSAIYKIKSLNWTPKAGIEGNLVNIKMGAPKL